MKKYDTEIKQIEALEEHYRKLALELEERIIKERDTTEDYIIENMIDEQRALWAIHSDLHTIRHRLYGANMCVVK